MHKTLLVCY